VKRASAADPAAEVSSFANPAIEVRFNRAAWVSAGRLERWYSSPLPFLRFWDCQASRSAFLLMPLGVPGMPGRPCSSEAGYHSLVTAHLQGLVPVVHSE